MDKILLPFETGIGWAIGEIYEVIPSVGIAIIIVTMLVMLLIFPLTHKQTKSMLATQALQPQMKAIQAKYKNSTDPEARQKQSAETMALYKEAGVNPLGGCLPTLIQMPFLFSIFRVVRDIQKYVGTDTKLFKALCSIGDTTVKTKELCKARGSTVEQAGYSKVQAAELAEKLPVGKQFFGLNLSKNFPAVMDQGPKTIAAYSIMIVLLAATSYISMHRQQAINPNTPSQMKILKYLFPIGISISGVILPAGSNLYILTSSTWRACQQEFLYRKIIKPHREKSEGNDKSEKNSDSGEIANSDSNYKPGLARQKRKKK